MKEMITAYPVFILYIEFYSLYPIIMYINIFIQYSTLLYSTCMKF